MCNHSLCKLALTTGGWAQISGGWNLVSSYLNGWIKNEERKLAMPLVGLSVYVLIRLIICFKDAKVVKIICPLVIILCSVLLSGPVLVLHL